uniref:Uncharacterized protein n=1 Tax=Romanomermis culicivorax TaxID=13658 RepID=A0A915JJ99_ROMCU
MVSATENTSVPNRTEGDGRNEQHQIPGYAKKTWGCGFTDWASSHKLESSGHRPTAFQCMGSCGSMPAETLSIKSFKSITLVCIIPLIT